MQDGRYLDMLGRLFLREYGLWYRLEHGLFKYLALRDSDITAVYGILRRVIEKYNVR